MQINAFELIVGLAGLISLGFNFFQLYRDRIKTKELDDQRKLHQTTLMSIWRVLTEGARSLSQLEHKGSDAATIASNMARVVDSQRIQIKEFLERYYGLKVNLEDSPETILTPSEELLSGGTVELIEGVEAITDTMIKTVEYAEKYIFTLGGRSRNDAYLEVLKQRVGRGDIRYVRVITGDHIRHPLCTHIRDIINRVELGYLKEDKYGGIIATDKTVIIALYSSRVATLDKALRIENDRIASDYRLYILGLLKSSTTIIDASLIQTLCTTCRKNHPVASEIKKE